MGFDFLRDRLLKRRITEGHGDLFGEMLGGASAETNEKPVQRDLFFMLADEADSILIDEARTPSSSAPCLAKRKKSPRKRTAGLRSVSNFEEEEHYDYDHDDRKVELTLPGRRLTRELPKHPAMSRIPLSTIYEYVEQSIKVDREMFLDRHYVVRDGEIVIVDEFTGRLAEGRKWRAEFTKPLKRRKV